MPATTDRAALEQIAKLIKQFGGECPSTNYSLLVKINKIALSQLKGAQK